jgi:tetratricopeptide (TPR) repeat protein
MPAPQRTSAAQPALGVEHVDGSSPAAFKLTRLEDGNSLPAVAIPSPYEFPVEGRPNSPLMRELRWYLEQFLDYPFYPETDHAEHVLDALRAWGTQAFNALFDRRDAGTWLAPSTTLQVRADDAHVLSWPWEALYDPQAGVYLAHQRRLERRLNRLPDPQPAAVLPNERVNILLVVCRPLEHDVRYRSIARPLIELIQSRNLPAHVDILRPPTFDQLREHLRQHPGYYHVLHFDGHGAYAPSGYSSPREFKARTGYLVFENEEGRDDARPAKDIAALLREHPVPAAVLNACQAGAIDEQAENAFAAVATALLQSGIRSVVAMAYSLYVSGAQVFLPAFYGRLFESGSVAEGVRAGRQQMLADRKRMSARGPYPLEDWLLPVLYRQAPLDFTFATKARLEARESRLPQEVLKQREAYGFIGRDGPILEMERALQRNMPCILLQGLAGIGKTTLARGFLRWLDETGGLDGALWFDFRDIRTAEYVLNRTGEMFYGENFGVASKKFDMLADALRQHSVLMVWDNFESTAEKFPSNDRDELGRFLDAIRGTPSKVIMTSRSPEPWLGPTRRVELRLSGLEGEERSEYCETILRELGLKVDRDDPELNELMDQLAGHPLAMRVVLPKLEHMTASKVSEALRTNIAELGLSEEEEQGRLFATLRFVEQGLPEQLRSMMGLIGLHEAYLDARYLEAMAKQVDPEWTGQRVDQLVAKLAKAGLVRDIGGATYEIHPLLTSYLRSRGAAPEVCQRAFVDVMGSLADRLSALPYHEQRGPFLLHGANFHFALHLSQRFAMDQDFFAALTQSLAIYARLSRNIVEASRLSSQLAQRGSAVMNWNLEAHGYLQLGIIAQEQRDFATAREWCFKSLAISEKQGYPQGAALTYRQLGMIAQGERDFAAAREWYLKSLNIKEQQGDLDGAANTYQHLGIVAQEERDFATAREWYLKSLAIKEKRGNLHEAAMTYGQLGIVAARQGNFEEGGKWYARAITGFQQTRDQHEVERNVQNFLIAYRRVPSAEKEKLKAIWLEAGLGAFPA